MKKCIIITTINEVNDVLVSFSKSEYDLIIVGDKKSPDTYDIDCVYLNLDEQIEKYSKLSSTIPINHYSRKNIGYIYAIENGYNIIAESDDDNMPLDNWGEIPTKHTSLIGEGEINIYSLFGKDYIWPRGYPINKIGQPSKFKQSDVEQKPVVWQFMVNGDPDVDAVCRLTQGKLDIEFGSGEYSLSKGLISPFNTQNTFWIDDKFFIYTYLPATVSFRYTDILRSFVAQYGIWAMGGYVGFASPSVYQDRNEHDLMKDFKQEYTMYTTYYDVVKAFNELELNGDKNDIMLMYNKLLEMGIVDKKEIETLNEWIKYF